MRITQPNWSADREIDILFVLKVYVSNSNTKILCQTHSWILNVVIGLMFQIWYLVAREENITNTLEISENTIYEIVRCCAAFIFMSSKFIGMYGIIFAL